MHKFGTSGYQSYLSFCLLSLFLPLCVLTWSSEGFSHCTQSGSSLSLHSQVIWKEAKLGHKEYERWQIFPPRTLSMKIDFAQLDEQSIQNTPKFKILIDNILCLKMATVLLLIFFIASYSLCESPWLLPQYQMCTHAYTNRMFSSPHYPIQQQCSTYSPLDK